MKTLTEKEITEMIQLFSEKRGEDIAKLLTLIMDLARKGDEQTLKFTRAPGVPTASSRFVDEFMLDFNVLFFLNSAVATLSAGRLNFGLGSEHKDGVEVDIFRLVKV